MLPQGVQLFLYSFLTLQELIVKVSKLSRADRDIISKQSEILDQNRDLSIKIEESLKYDSESLKTMFRLVNGKLRFDIQNISGSAPYTVMRYVLAKAKKHKVPVTVLLRFNLEKVIDTRELVDILMPYE